MATVILPPQDCLGKGLRLQGLVLSAPLNSRRKSNPNSSSTCSNPKLNHDDKSCSGRRRRSASVGLKANRQANRERSRVRESSTTAKMTTKSLVMGRVKILKRGEKLTPDRGVGGGVDGDGDGDDSCGKRRLESKGEEVDLVLGSTDRLGPDPDLMQKQVVLTEFKDGMYAGSGAFFASPPPSSVPLPSFVVKNGIATTDLRRLLRLDLE